MMINNKFRGCIGEWERLLASPLLLLGAAEMKGADDQCRVLLKPIAVGQKIGNELQESKIGINHTKASH